MSLVRGLYLISMAHYDVLSLLFKLLSLNLYLKTLNSHLCYYLLNIVIFICFFNLFLGNVTLCINLPNMTLSIMSPHYDQQLGHTSGRVSILIGVIVLYALAKLRYGTSTKVIMSRTKNSLLVAVNFGKRCIFFITREFSFGSISTIGPNVGMV